MGVSTRAESNPKAELRTAFRPSLKAGLRTMRRRKSRSWPSPGRGRSKSGHQRRSGFGLHPRRDHRQPERRRASPLLGHRVIVTRAAKQSGEMTRARAISAEVISCPTIEIKEPSSWEQLDRALVHLSWYDWLAFTSVNGVVPTGRMDALGHGRFN